LWESSFPTPKILKSCNQYSSAVNSCKDKTVLVVTKLPRLRGYPRVSTYTLLIGQRTPTNDLNSSETKILALGTTVWLSSVQLGASRCHQPLPMVGYAPIWTKSSTKRRCRSRLR
jgi:hypothetical protein